MTSNAMQIVLDTLRSNPSTTNAQLDALMVAKGHGRSTSRYAEARRRLRASPTPTKPSKKASRLGFGSKSMLGLDALMKNTNTTNKDLDSRVREAGFKTDKTLYSKARAEFKNLNAPISQPESFSSEQRCLEGSQACYSELDIREALQQLKTALIKRGVVTAGFDFSESTLTGEWEIVTRGKLEI